MKRVVVIFGILVLAGCGGGGSSTYSATFQEFLVPVGSNQPSSGDTSSWPDDLVGDDVGNIWFAQFHSNEIGKMTASGQYTGYPVPTRFSHMDSIAIDLSRRTIYVTQVTGNQ